MRNRGIGFIPLALLLALVATLAGCAQAPEEKEVTIGNKYFTENEVLGKALAYYLEDKGYTVNNRGFQGSLAILEAMERGEVDIYYDYTGTITESVLGLNLLDRGIADPEEYWKRGKAGMEEEYGFTLAEHLTYEHTYTLSIPREKAEELGIESIGDLRDYDQDWIMATDEETLTRPDGYPRVQELYDLNFKETRSMDITMAYPAIKRGDIDVIIGLSMDARQKKFNLLNLDDPKGWQPRYHPVPVIDQKTLDKYPELKDQVNSLVPHLEQQKVLAMVKRVDIDGEDPDKVVQDFLKQEGLV